MVNQTVGSMRADGRISGTSQELDKQASAQRITDLVSKEDVNPQAVERGVQLILKAVKESAGWTRDLFLLIRSCKEVEIAWGSLVTAEARAVVKFREMIKAEDPNYKGAIKNLSDIGKYQQAQLSYVTTKSKLKGIIDSSDDLCAKLQEWWLFQAKHDGEPHKSLPDGYLDCMSNRYADDKKGSTLFMRDAREAQAGAEMLSSRQARLDAENAKKAGAETGQNGEQTQQGIVSGTNVDQKGLQVKSTQEALNRVIRLVHDADNHDGVEISDLNQALTLCGDSIQKLLDKANDAIRTAVSGTATRPIRSEVAASAATAGTDASVENTDAGSEASASGLVRPEWIPDDMWGIMTANEQAKALDDGQEAWAADDAEIVAAGEALKDAESNEPKVESDNVVNG